MTLAVYHLREHACRQQTNMFRILCTTGIHSLPPCHTLSLCNIFDNVIIGEPPGYSLTTYPVLTPILNPYG